MIPVIVVIAHDASRRRPADARTVSARSMGTVSRSVSYILRFLHAVLRMMRRKVVLSMAHSEPGDIAFMPKSK